MLVARRSGRRFWRAELPAYWMIAVFGPAIVLSADPDLVGGRESCDLEKSGWLASSELWRR